MTAIANDKGKPDKVRDHLTELRDLILEIGDGNWNIEIED